MYSQTKARKPIQKKPNPTKSNLKMLGEKALKKHLKVLNLEYNTEEEKPLPSFPELRKAFRMQLMEHPDKGGNNEHFQNITQAFRVVMEHCLGHQSLVKPTPEMETKPEKALLEAFESENKVEVNETNVVVHLEMSMVDKWMASFDSYFTLKKKEPVRNGWLYKDLKWKVPHTNMEPDTLSVYIYDKVKTGPKFVVQGKYYLAFVTVVLPKISETLGKSPTEFKQISWAAEVEEEKLEEVMKRKNGDKHKENFVKPTETVVKPSEHVEKPVEKDTEYVKSMEEAFAETSNDNESNPNSLENQFKRLQIGLIAGFRVMESKLTISMEKQNEMESKVESQQSIH